MTSLANSAIRVACSSFPCILSLYNALMWTSVTAAQSELNTSDEQPPRRNSDWRYAASERTKPRQSRDILKCIHWGLDNLAARCTLWFSAGVDTVLNLTFRCFIQQYCIVLYVFGGPCDSN